MKTIKLKKIWKDRLNYLLVFVLITSIMYGMMLIANNRFEKIDNGTIKVIDHNAGDR